LFTLLNLLLKLYQVYRYFACICTLEYGNLSSLSRGCSIVGWIAVAVAFIVGGINFAGGDSKKGQKYVVGAVIAAVIMAFYTAIITGLIG